MTPKATVIGSTPKGVVAPTRLDGATSTLRPATTSTPIQPTTLGPTKLGAAPVAPPAAPAQAPKPTAMPAGVALPPHSAPVQASALPGTQRKPVEVSLAELTSRFPGLAADIKPQVQGVLAGLSLQTMSSSAWLAFGTSAQEEASELVKSRLSLMEASATRAATQHLTRLLALLDEVLDALNGGFMRRSVQKAWSEVEAEVRALEGLLNPLQHQLMALIGKFDELSGECSAVDVNLQAHALAAEYVLDLLDAQPGSLLVGRIAALKTSQALVLGQIQTLELDKTQVQELTALVQDGVLLKLPAVYSQMAGLPSKPSDTQRFIAKEKLDEIVQLLQRKM